MHVLVIGGTGFVGRHVVRRLVDGGHTVALFHRLENTADEDAVAHIRGDRRDLLAFDSEFRHFAPDVVLDTIAYSERDAESLMKVFRGVARRAVVLSSQDVYAAYGRFRRDEPGAPDPAPYDEEAGLRTRAYPYRALAKGPNVELNAELFYWYDKLLVERAALGDSELPGTVLRLPAVYGPGDSHHRIREYLKHMDDPHSSVPLDPRKAEWRWTRGYVENVAAAITLAVTDARATNGVYNVGEEPARTETEWIRSIGEAAGWFGRIVPAVDTPSTHETEQYDFRHDLVADTRRIRAELGYQEPVPFAEGLRRTVTWERG